MQNLMLISNPFKKVRKRAKKVIDENIILFFITVAKSVQPKTSAVGIQNMALLLLPIYLVLLKFLNPPQKLQAPLSLLASLLLFLLPAVAGVPTVA
jgi:hypothetical protein